MVVPVMERYVLVYVRNPVSRHVASNMNRAANNLSNVSLDNTVLEKVEEPFLLPCLNDVSRLDVLAAPDQLPY